ncbi:unnamed protein product [Alopecurus aequalis]
MAAAALRLAARRIFQRPFLMAANKELAPAISHGGSASQSLAAALLPKVAGLQKVGIGGCALGGLAVGTLLLSPLYVSIVKRAVKRRAAEREHREWLRARAF